MSSFIELLLEESHCDVVINVRDMKFKAHKILLCNCSLYFRNLFRSQPSGAYSFPHMSPRIMRLILEYAYTDSVVVTEENAIELLEAADRFTIKGMLKAGSDFLEQKLCVENCISTGRSADHYNCPDLRQKADLYVLDHFEEVAGTSEEFLKLSVQQLADFIEKDELNVRQESAVFEAIVRWIHHAPEARRSHMSMLLDKVRLLLMTSDDLMDMVRRNSLVRRSLRCLAMVTNAMKTQNESSMERPLTCTRLPYAVLLVIGVLEKDYPPGSIEIYNNRTDCWLRLGGEWVEGGEAPREFYGSVYLNGFVYFIGGFDTFEYLNSVRRLKLITRTWEEVGPMHSCRCYASVVVLNGCIYAMGGCDAYKYHNTAERYNPDTNQWTLIAPMHQQRCNTKAATLHGKIYICAGYNGEERLSSAECYDPHTNQWTLIAPMETGLNGAAVIAYNDLIYVAGGFDGVRSVNSVAAYDPRSDSWHKTAPMINSRSHFGIAVLEDLLYAVGGFESCSLTCNVERYDGNTNRWKSVQHLHIACRTPSCYVVERRPYFSASHT